jgi:glycosyltransferase involved in cell wall biosynthesis
VSRVLFWTASDDGSSWYRADLPSEALRWEGHATAATQKVSHDLLMDSDVVVGSRIASVSAASAWELLAARPAAERPRLLLDMDDAYFQLDPANPAASHWDIPQLNRLARSIIAADTITVPSEALAEHVLRFVGRPSGKELDVQVIPNGLHAGLLGTPRDYEADQREITVGWSGTASSARDFDLVAHALGRIVEYGDGQVKLRLIGLPKGHPSTRTLQRLIPKRLHDLVEAVEWVKHGQPYLSACASFDIWVAPYRSDPFVDAKFPTKALEAGTLGIPLVASDVLPYRRWDGPDPAGLVLVDEHKPWMWGRCLKTLVDSAAARQSMGEAARSRAALNIMQAVGPMWSRVCKLDTLLPKEART